VAEKSGASSLSAKRRMLPIGGSLIDRKSTAQSQSVQTRSTLIGSMIPESPIERHGKNARSSVQSTGLQREIGTEAHTQCDAANRKLGKKSKQNPQTRSEQGKNRPTKQAMTKQAKLLLQRYNKAA
jgi:hypothetical protein